MVQNMTTHMQQSLRKHVQNMHLLKRGPWAQAIRLITCDPMRPVPEIHVLGRLCVPVFGAKSVHTRCACEAIVANNRRKQFYITSCHSYTMRTDMEIKKLPQLHSHKVCT